VRYFLGATIRFSDANMGKKSKSANFSLSKTRASGKKQRAVP
jgi:hypothetical protein